MRAKGFQYIECWYHKKRRHSLLGNTTINKGEKQAEMEINADGKHVTFKANVDKKGDGTISATASGGG